MITYIPPWGCSFYTCVMGAICKTTPSWKDIKAVRYYRSIKSMYVVLIKGYVESYISEINRIYSTSDHHITECTVHMPV